jgi:hypothetical protein
MIAVRERAAVRVSVNALGEYMEATADRRQKIVADQKAPKDYVVPRYTLSTQSIAACLSAPADHLRPVRAAIERLRKARPLKPWEATTVANNLAALEAFEKLWPSLSEQFSGLTVARGGVKAPKLLLSGVQVSVRPDLILRGQNRQGRGICGALKLRLTKTTALSERGLKCIATTLNLFTETHLAKGLVVADPAFCFVLDVFTGKLVSAPKSQVRLRKEILTTCREIALWWNSVPVPTESVPRDAV